MTIIDKYNDYILKYENNFFITQESSGKIIAAGVIDCINWSESYFKSVIECFIKTLPNGDAW